MTAKLTRRVAADLLKRGVSAIRIKESAQAEAGKAITRDDVRRMIEKGEVFAQPEKRNISAYSKVLKEKRAQGRRRGSGRKRGTANARASIEWKKKVRAQRRVLIALKGEKKIDNKLFKNFYRLVRGSTFPSKASLLAHIKDHGVAINEEQFKKLKHI